MSKPRKTFRKLVTDDQVHDALEAAQAEFARWRMVPMGHAGTRIIYDPLAGRALGSLTMAEGADLKLTYHDTPLTGDAAKATFDLFRSHAGMRAALETL